MTKTLTVKKAQEELPILIKNAKAKSVQYVITVNGVPSAIIMPIPEEEYTSESETAEILADKGLMRDIRQAEKEVAAGKMIPWEKVKKELGINV